MTEAIDPLRETGNGTLILVRHGETVGQSSIRYYGRTDVALSDPGRAQMRAAADALAAIRFERVFTSPLSRSREGAQLIVAHSPNRERAPAAATIEEFVEVDFGRFEGLTADEIKARWPDDYATWRELRLHDSYRYPGGESRTEFNARVERGIERMFELWRDGGGALPGAALLVAHRGVIRAIVKRLAGLEPEIELGSIQVLRRTDRHWRAAVLDLTDHLRSPII